MASALSALRFSICTFFELQAWRLIMDERCSAAAAVLAYASAATRQSPLGLYL